MLRLPLLFLGGEPQMTNADPTLGSTSSRGRILVVDDDLGLRESLSAILSSYDFEVETFEEGASAIEQAKKQKFDLALTDLNMAGMDGVQTVGGLKEVDPDIEIIVLTGGATVETAVACMKRGAYDYVLKPFDPEELIRLLERALEKRHLKSSLELHQARDPRSPAAGARR